MAEKTAAERVALARHPQRPNITDYIDGLFTDFFEQRGDRACREDPAILGGIALFHGRPVTVIGTRKGKTLEENLRCNFGMPGPEGYRKALRLMKQAEKFRRPIFTFIDTAGAYPGLEAEEHGQGEAIARNLFEMSRLTVPVIAVVTGEGNSGGALALAVADRVLMLENAVYAILSPEGFASILWKDAQRSGEAAELIEKGYTNIICAQPFGCLPNHIVGKGTIRRLRELYPKANIFPVDYDSGASKANQENRIKLMLAMAKEERHETARA